MTFVPERYIFPPEDLPELSEMPVQLSEQLVDDAKIALEKVFAATGERPPQTLDELTDYKKQSNLIVLGAHLPADAPDRVIIKGANGRELGTYIDLVFYAGNAFSSEIVLDSAARTARLSDRVGPRVYLTESAFNTVLDDLVSASKYLVYPDVSPIADLDGLEESLRDRLRYTEMYHRDSSSKLFDWQKIEREERQAIIDDGLRYLNAGGYYWRIDTDSFCRLVTNMKHSFRKELDYEALKRIKRVYGDVHIDA